MKRGAKPKSNINCKWSPELAYIVGLIVTDGNLSKDGRHINFTSKDIQLVELFKECLRLNVSIGKKTRSNEKEKKYFQVQFGNVLFYKWLVGLGLTPNKSRTLEKLKIPDKYFFDFLRGCFDGDGCIYAYWDKRWHSSFMYYLSFSSASYGFLLWLNDTTERLAAVNGRIGKAQRSYSLKYAKKNTSIIFKKMFHKKELPCLHRKLIKAKQIFAVDKRHKKSAQVEELVYSIG